MLHTYDDGEAIFTGDEVAVPGSVKDQRSREAEVMQVRKDGKRLRVLWVDHLLESAKSEWVDTEGCEMIRRNQ